MTRVTKNSVCVAAALALTMVCAPALADLAPGGVQYNPELTIAPAYTSGLPSYFAEANLKAMLEAPWEGAGGFIGTTTSWVYENPTNGCLTFAYLWTSESGPILRSSTLGGEWGGVTVFATGADGSGESGTNDVDPEWTDGDPHSFVRDGFDGSIAVEFRVSNVGTVIGPGDDSAIAWIETDVKSWTPAVAALIDGGSDGHVAILTVPAPGAAMLAMLGLGVVGLVRKSRA